MSDTKQEPSHREFFLAIKKQFLDELPENGEDTGRELIAHLQAIGALYQHAKDAERIADIESKLAIATTALEEIGQKTETDPAGEVELRARAAYVYKLYREVLEKLK